MGRLGTKQLHFIHCFSFNFYDLINYTIYKDNNEYSYTKLHALESIDEE